MADTNQQLQRKFNKTELANEVLKLRAQVRQEGTQDPNIREAGERAGQEALDNVTSLSPEEMAAYMTSLGVSVNNTLQQVTSEIIQGRNTLADLERACDAKTGELEKLFGQEVVARSIGNALADHDAKRKEFADKEVELTDKLARAEASAQQRQTEWSAQFSKDCKRAGADFDYQFAKDQREQRDAFASQLKNERTQYDDDQRDRDREWQIKDEDIAKRMITVAGQEKEQEAAEETLKAKFEKEKHTVTSAMKREHEHAMAIAQTNSQTAAQIAASTIATQTDQLRKHEDQIEQLKKQLADSQGKNTELANKALESASRSFALDAVMQQGQDGQSSGRGRAKA